MDKDVIADLKQFIATTVSQQLALQTEDLRKEFRTDIGRLEKKVDDGTDRLEEKIDDLSASVAEALDTSNEETDRQLKNHERRIKQLERKTA